MHGPGVCLAVHQIELPVGAVIGQGGQASFLLASTGRKSPATQPSELWKAPSKARQPAATRAFLSAFRRKTATRFTCLRVPLTCFPLPQWQKLRAEDGMRITFYPLLVCTSLEKTGPKAPSRWLFPASWRSIRRFKTLSSGWTMMRRDGWLRLGYRRFWQVSTRYILRRRWKERTITTFYASGWDCLLPSATGPSCTGKGVRPDEGEAVGQCGLGWAVSETIVFQMVPLRASRREMESVILSQASCFCYLHTACQGKPPETPRWMCHF